VAVVRLFTPPVRIPSGSGRVSEPELDMSRLGPRQSSAASILHELMRKLLLGGNSVVRSPMRSIAREIEEAWPSGER
jgi:hypothetical protein